MDIFNVYLLLFTEITLFGMAWYMFKGDFISPSIVTLALFSLSTACFAYNTNDWIVVFTFRAYLLFLLTFVLMILTERFLTKIKICMGNVGKKRSYNYVQKKIILICRPLDTVLFTFFVLCALLYIYRVYQSGISLGATSLLTSIGVNKEEGDYDGMSRLMYNLLRMASYVYIVIFANNVYGCKQSIKKNKKSLIIILLTLLVTFFSGQRSTAICYLASIVVGVGIFINDGKKRNQQQDMKKYFRKVLLVGGVVLMLFFASANVVKGTNIQRNFISYMTYYFGSTTALMGRIVEEPEICHTPFAGYFGEKTFSGFWNTLYSMGIVDKAPCDRRWINMGGADRSMAGNEYTFLCGPYIDFGFIGTLVFVILFYALFSYIYYWKIKKKENCMQKYVWCAIYIFLYGLVAMTFYQDTVRSYSRPINILYILYIILFCKFFLRTKKLE